MTEAHGRVNPKTTRGRGGRGFSLVELMIVVLIIAILAAIVVPRFSGAAQLATGSAIEQDLRYVRQQIQVYRAQHFGVSPGYVGGDPSGGPSEAAFIEQMTKPTSATGQVGSTPSDVYRFGPYLAEVPVNPVNGSSAILIIADSGSMPEPPSEMTPYGWVYKAATLEFRAYVPGTDENGVRFYDY